MKANNVETTDLRKAALSLVLMMGIVSLFSDMTHEGAKSIYGDFLSLAGASAAVIGFVSGLGEFIGYALRLLTGYLADKRRNYWQMTFIGYAVNMLAIPLLALTLPNGWLWASLLIVSERVGKAIRQPSKATIVSFASSQVGTGKAFALQEFMDQIGAFSGPVLLFLVIYFKPGSQALFDAYRLGFLVLLIPALLTLYFLYRAKVKFPNPEQFESDSVSGSRLILKRPFILFLVAISFLAFGFIDFPILTMHVARLEVLPAAALPLLYAWAMLVDAFAALAFGWLFDKKGFSVLLFSSLFSVAFAPFAFLSESVTGIMIGVTLWGIGMGAQESVLKAAVATLVPKENRSSGYGLFETSFGLFWFLGSWLMGVLYGYSLPAMVTVSVVAQSIAIVCLLFLRKK